MRAACWSVGDLAERKEDHFLVKAGEVHQITRMYRGGYLGFAMPIGGEWNPDGWQKVETPDPDAVDMERSGIDQTLQSQLYKGD